MRLPKRSVKRAGINKLTSYGIISLAAPVLIAWQGRGDGEERVEKGKKRRMALNARPSLINLAAM